MQLKKNVSLQPLNTLSAPSIARLYTSVDSLSDLRQAVTWARQTKTPFYVLAGGSNTIPCDFIDGLVIQPKILGLHEKRQNENAVIVTAGAGENWHKLVMHCVDREYYGIENLALIPGDCGAAPIQNIGAYGVELKDVFYQLSALNLATMEEETFSKESCKFAYRDSVFKSELKEKCVITSISLRLSLEPFVNIEYQALKDMARSLEKKEPSVREVADMVIAIRSSKLPNPETLPNAGSFFKNPIVSATDFAELKRRFPEIVSFPTDNKCRKIAAAWLLDTLGWKGKTVHGVKLHDQHALVMTNPAHLSATKILLAADEIIQDVEKAFNIRLEIEPQLLGDLK